MVYQYGVWFCESDARAAGFAQDDLIWLIYISVIYLDRGNDSVTLKYNIPMGLRNIRFKKANTGVWMGDQASDAIRVADFCFDNAVNGGGLQLFSNQDGEDILHMTKLERPDEYFVLKIVPPARVVDPGQVATYTIDV